MVIIGIPWMFCGQALAAIRGCHDGRIAFDSLRNGSRDIYVMSGPSSPGQPPAPEASPLRLTTGADDAKPSWSPPDANVNNFCDSKPIGPYTPPPTMVAFQRTTQDGNTNIYRIDAATPEPTGQAIQVTNDVGADTAPAWAPFAPANAPHLTYPPIAFVRMVNGHHDIFIVNSDGTDETDLTGSVGPDYENPDWSPGGDLQGTSPSTMSLAFDSDQDGRREIRVMDIAYVAANPTGHRYVSLGMREVTAGQPPSSNPSWFTFTFTTTPTPIQSQIAFAGPDADPGPSQINTATPTTVGDTSPPFADPSSIDFSALTNDSTDNSAPAWSPTGDFLAYQKTAPDGNSDIYVLNPKSDDETTDVNLTEHVGDNRNPDWEPVQILSVDVYPIRPLGRRHRKRLPASDVSTQTVGPATPAVPPPPTVQPPPVPAPMFSGRLLSITANGHRLNRTIVVQVRVNAAATVTAVLARGPRRVARHVWRVFPGHGTVRLKVPLAAPPGNYQVRLTLRPAGGSPTSFTRRVHLGR